MFSLYKSALDSEDRVVLEIGMNALLMQAAAVVVPLLMMGAAYFAMGRGPMGMPWYLIAGPIFVAVFGFFVTGWMCKRTKVQVTVDSKAGKLLVNAGGSQSEIAMADVARAEFGVTTDSEDNSVSRLEFVMKNGERIPATSSYSNMYGRGDQAKMVAAITSALA